MPCPFHSPDDEDDRGVDDDELAKSALVIGSRRALETLIGADGGRHPAGRGRDPETVDRRNRQHAWGAGAGTGTGAGAGDLPPRHHLLLFADYEGSGPPTAEDRQTVESAFRGLEDAFGWGPDGLVFAVGYSPAYFDRFDRARPVPDRFRRPEETIRALTPDDAGAATPDRYDVALHLASDHAANLLAAELALWGEPAAGPDPDATLEGVFTRPSAHPERRTGVSRAAATAASTDAAGRRAADGGPTEGAVTLGAGGAPGASPFADGTIMHVSELEVDREALREARDAGGTTGTETHADADARAETHHRGLATGGGDGTRTAAERMLRRASVATGSEGHGSHFVALVADTRAVVDARRAMDVGDEGGTSHLHTERRGNYLVPPLYRRALPDPEPEPEPEP